MAGSRGLRSERRALAAAQGGSACRLSSGDAGSQPRCAASPHRRQVDALVAQGVPQRFGRRRLLQARGLRQLLRRGLGPPAAALGGVGVLGMQRPGHGGLGNRPLGGHPAAGQRLGAAGLGAAAGAAAA